MRTKKPSFKSLATKNIKINFSTGIKKFLEFQK